MSDEDEINYDEEPAEEYSDGENNENVTSSGIKYEILKKKVLEKERDSKIDEFIQISDLPRSQAELVLMNNNWNIDILMNDWYDKMQKIKENSGISQTKESTKKLKEYLKTYKVEKGICPVCETDIDEGDGLSLGCGHEFCTYCYKEYLKEKMNDQLTLLASTCPMKNCNYQVPSEIFKNLFKDDKNELNIYKKCLIRNFTESNADVKLCPNPKCDKIIKLPGHGMFDIKCECGTSFCFKCLKDSHRPCDCYMLEVWEKKTKNDAENVKWLLVNTKQCPNCKKYIEKNQGCNHMTCRKEAGGCGYEFCWICLGEWAPHGTSWYKCTRVNQKELDKKQKEITNIKLEMEKFDKSYQNFNDEENSIKYALKLEEKIELYKKFLTEKKSQTQLDVLFLDDALKTVIECHRLLKNTYIFGYYMKKNAKSLFEHHQEMLRREADLLHEKIEMRYLTDILSINEEEKFKKDFTAYKEKVISLTNTTNKFKNNILEDIEKHPEYLDYNTLKSAK